MFIFCQSTNVRAGFYPSKSDTSKHFIVKVNSLAFAFGNFRPYSSEFVSQHVTAAAVRLKQQPTSRKKSNEEKKGKQIRYMKKRKQTENGKTPGSEQPVVKSVCGSRTMR